MLYHGIDLVVVARIDHAVARWGDRFLRRVWTARELVDSRARGPSLAARWAAKEAAGKALGIGLRGLGGTTSGVGWHDIEVVSGPRRQPSLQLSGAAAARAAELGWRDVVLSLSHTDEHAIASVVAWSG